ncbi:PP-loop family domain containing protein [Amanita muscaria]
MRTATNRLLAISKDEFKHWFQKCTPSNGWSKVLAVANSGGPDSTCLLFLLHRYLSGNVLPNLPQRIVSVTVDHDLQPSSVSMADSCAKFARLLPGVEHITTKIPWSNPPFPRRPVPGVEAIENTARLARYEMLFRSMREVRPEAASVIAFGHHADDQVETALMRFGRGTTELGGAGMRSCRRWGMGHQTLKDGEDTLGWNGMEGMDKWIVRPLLDVSKDRILATCEENNLEYVTDQSNFQPHITIRNAIRKLLTKGSRLDDSRVVSPEPLPNNIKEQLSNINTAISSLESVSVDLDSGAERLRSAVKHLTLQVQDIDCQVDSHLKRCMIPSPTGTFLMSSRNLASIQGDLLRTALILRVMRYVSFYPWGSLRADGNRRKKMREQIIDKLWTLNPFQAGIGMFVAGGGVLWTPVLVRGNNLKTPERLVRSGFGQDEVIGWLASRQPPLNKRKMEERNMRNPLRVDVTENLKQVLDKARETPFVDILWDCRFLVRFDLSKMPLNIRTELANSRSNQSSTLIVSNTRWYWPEIVLQQEKEQTVLHSDIKENKRIPPFLGPEDDVYPRRAYWRRYDAPVVSDWIHVEWIRPLTAI